MLEELLAFTENKEMEYREDLLVMWLDPEDLKEFSEVLGDDVVSDGGVNMVLCPGGVVAVVMDEEFARRLDIKPEEIFPRD